MTKTYNFKYENEKYILAYNNPISEMESFIIDANSMQFDTKYFYEYVFQDVNEKLSLCVENQMDEKEIGLAEYKKGIRIFKVIDDLCKIITEEINKQCFDK